MSDDKGNVVGLPSKRSDVAADLAYLRGELGNLIELNKIAAKLHRETFLAYCQQGFNESQALKLTIHVHGMMGFIEDD